MKRFAKIRGCLIAMIMIAGIGWASDTEALLRCDKVTFAGPGEQVEVSFAGLHGKQFGVSVRIRDKVIKVPEKFLFGASEINIDSIRLTVPAPRRDTPLWEQAADDGLWVILDFGAAYQHGTEDKPVTVYKALLLQFEKGHLMGAELAVPEGEFKNRWKFRYREPNAPDAEDRIGEYGPKDSVKCPWWSGDRK